MNSEDQSNLISIIIPVYNVEQYLDRCLDSIVNQTHLELDIILVDDGSKDSSSKICDTWARKDHRIHVIHQKNSGQAAARNAGLAIAKGKYIAFVDSDDVVEPDYISTMLNAAMTHNADLVICSFFDHMKLDHMVTPLPDSVQSGLETFHFAISHDDWHYRPVWNRLYTRDLCFRGGDMFPEGRACEDDLTFHKILPEANCVVTLSKPLYHYMDNPASITHASVSLNSLNKIEAYLDWYEFSIAHNFTDCYQQLASTTLYFLIEITSQLSFISDKTINKRIRSLIMRYANLTNSTIKYLSKSIILKSIMLQKKPIFMLSMLIARKQLGAYLKTAVNWQ